MHSVNQGLTDINSGDLLDTEELREQLKKQRLARKSI